ncbi:MAG: hypothetical protein FWD49_08010 [Firmicutes bacterium]|nr:hypothetical protein [Bacillota bacterium]
MRKIKALKRKNLILTLITLSLAVFCLALLVGASLNADLSLAESPCTHENFLKGDCTKCADCGEDNGNEHNILIQGNFNCTAPDYCIIKDCNFVIREGNPSHTYGTKPDNCTHDGTCLSCSYPGIPGIQHLPNGAKAKDCMADERCAVLACNVLIEAGNLSHSFLAEKTTQNALKTQVSCELSAIYFKSCTNCIKISDSNVEIFIFGEPLGHEYDWIETTAPTESEFGEETLACLLCDKTDGTRELPMLEKGTTEPPAEPPIEPPIVQPPVEPPITEPPIEPPNPPNNQSPENGGNGGNKDLSTGAIVGIVLSSVFVFITALFSATAILIFKLKDETIYEILSFFLAVRGKLGI